MPLDCTSTGGDAKGLLVISGTGLRFYESRASVEKVAESTPARLVADFAFSGEGQQWNRRLRLELKDGGRALVRTEQGADAMPGPLTYRKCEG